MSAPPESPFQKILKRASNHLEFFFGNDPDLEKVLFVDPELVYVTSRIVHPSTIESCFSHIYTYESNNNKFDFQKIVIFTTGAEVHLKQYVELLSKAKNAPEKIHFIFSNRFTFTERQFFETHGFLHRVVYKELRLPAWVLDDEIATLEMPQSFTDLYIEGGTKCIENIQACLKSIPNYEFFSNLYLIGQAALKIGDAIQTNYKSAWSHIIIYDRTVDSVTPFVPALTYEGQVAEWNEIFFGVTRLDNGDTVKLSKEDAVYTQIADMKFQEVMEYLKTLAQTLKADLDRFKTETDMNKMRQIKNESIMANQFLDCHRELAVSITLKASEDKSFKDRLDYELTLLAQSNLEKFDFMNSTLVFTSDWRNAVHLLALYCTTSKKVPQLDDVMQAIIDRFGMKAIASLWSLEEAKIVVPRNKDNGWSKRRDEYHLIDTDEAEKIARPYSGYIPFIARIIQRIVKSQWGSMAPHFSEMNIPYKSYLNREQEMKRILVVFVGGVMYGEIEALRALQETVRINIDILTTEIFSCNKLINSLAGIEDYDVIKERDTKKAAPPPPPTDETAVPA